MKSTAGQGREDSLNLSERLTVRHFREDDPDERLALLSDPAVMRHPEPPYDRKQSEEFPAAAGLRRTPLLASWAAPSSAAAAEGTPWNRAGD